MVGRVGPTDLYILYSFGVAPLFAGDKMTGDELTPVVLLPRTTRGHQPIADEEE